MQKVLCLLLSIVSFGVNAAVAKKQIVIDQVVAIVYQNEAPDFGSKDVSDDLIIITQQDVERRSFDGKGHSTAEIVDEVLFYQKAESLKMSLSPEDIDRQLEKMGMTQVQQLAITERHHYFDVDEFKAALKNMYVANMSLGFEIESSLVISEEEVRAYYDQNPVWLEAEYEVQTCFVSCPKEQDQLALQSKLAHFAQTGKGYKAAWEDAIVVKLSEVSTDNQFLTQLEAGQIYLKAVPSGFDLFRMVAVRPRRLQPLVERKGEIVNEIRSERYPKILEQVKKDLQAKSSVFYPKQF